jgi:short subunit fatty acids transporter
MSIAFAISVGLIMGIVFGFALEKSRVFEPGMIVGQMQLTNFIMLKVFLSAVATGAVALAMLNGIGLIALQPKPAFYAADMVGGLLLGAGIALAGACPGTVLAQIGVGYRDAFFTLAGGLCGALVYSYATPRLANTLFTAGGGKLILSQALGVPYWQAVVLLVAVIVVILFALEFFSPWRDELGKDIDGDRSVPRPSARAQRTQHQQNK